MIIDIHTHTGNKKIRSTIDDLTVSMKRYEIDRSVVFPLTQSRSNGVVLESIKNSKIVGVGNEIMPFLRFDPAAISISRLKELSTSFVGFKLHPRGEKFDPLNRRFSAIFELIGETGKPVLIHTKKERYRYSDPDRMIALAKRHRNTKFIFAHFANDSQVFFEKLFGLENAFVETSIVSSPKIIELRVDMVGADKILFGSDFPYSDQEIELLKIKKCAIKDSDRRKILYENAVRVLTYT